MFRRLIPGITALITTVAATGVQAAMPRAPSLPFFGPTPTQSPAPVDGDLASKIVASLHKIPTPLFASWKDLGPRDPTLRDPARIRDATSLGSIHTASPSAAGAALAAGGLAGGALFSLGKIGHEVVRVGPLLSLGGGGIRLSLNF